MYCFFAPDDSYEAWDALGEEHRMEILRQMPLVVADHEDEMVPRRWLAERTGIPVEGIPGHVDK